jgi:hypothetical protein
MFWLQAIIRLLWDKEPHSGAGVRYQRATHPTQRSWSCACITLGKKPFGFLENSQFLIKSNGYHFFFEI